MSQGELQASLSPAAKLLALKRCWELLHADTGPLLADIAWLEVQSVGDERGMYGRMRDAHQQVSRQGGAWTRGRGTEETAQMISLPSAARLACLDLALLLSLLHFVLVPPPCLSLLPFFPFLILRSSFSFLPFAGCTGDQGGPQQHAAAVSWPANCRNACSK